MLNITGKFVKVLETEDKGRYVQAKLGTSRKDKRDDTYINSNWMARFVGDCVGLAKTLSKGDKITINKGSIESVYDKEKQRTWTTVTVFEFEVDGESKGIDFSKHVKPQGGFTPIEPGSPEDDSLPF
jgi:hypothetical protein